MEKICECIKEKNVLFISTKNKDYIRNQQEIRLLRQYAQTSEEIVFSDNSYIIRILKVWTNCFKRKCKRADVIFVGFAPQLLLPFLFKWKKNKIVIIDFFISLYDTFVLDRKYFTSNSLIAKILHWVDEKTLENCEHVVVDTYADAGYFSKELHVPQEKMTVYYLEANTDIYDVQKYSCKTQNDRISVLYFGSILPLQGVEVILESAKLLEDCEKIEFIIIGPVSPSEKTIYKNNHSNIRFYRWLSQEELAEKIVKSDLCLAGHFNGEIEKARRTIPGKAYIYEAMGKRMILGDNSANREVFPEDDRHFYAEMGNPVILADLIRDIGLGKHN